MTQKRPKPIVRQPPSANPKKPAPKPGNLLLPEGFDLQGHRGCRGLMPENSIPGFLFALEMGVMTLEMDVVVTRDSEIILSHDPWFSPAFCRMPDGSDILEGPDKPLIYSLTSEEIQSYDCGLKPYSDFPEQRKIRAPKPLLRDVVDAADQYSKEHGKPCPRYNIETKSTPEGDHKHHPDPGTFAELLTAVLHDKGIVARSTVQSFDTRTLKHLNSGHPEVTLALLVEDRVPMDVHLDELGFTPSVYSPDYRLVNPALASACHLRGMKLIPWTVNRKTDMKRMVRWGVDGLITDYPNRFYQIWERS